MTLVFCLNFCLSKLSYCWKCSFAICCWAREYWLTPSHRNCCPSECLFSSRFRWLYPGWRFFGSRTKVQVGHTASWEVLLPWCRWCWSLCILQFLICTLKRRINPGHYCPMSHLFIQQAHLCLSQVFPLGRQVDFNVILTCYSQARILCFLIGHIPLPFP